MRVRNGAGPSAHRLWSAYRSRDEGGVGLGLAIAWAVEANGDRIELESGEEKGSSFRVVLPVAGR